MSTDRHRRISAWSLLVVMVSMLALSALHVHKDVRSYADECYQCTHHQHHSGHLYSGSFHIHDCVLCQIASTPYMAATLIAVIALLPVHSFILDFHPSVPCGMAWNRIPARAPPVSMI